LRKEATEIECTSKQRESDGKIAVAAVTMVATIPTVVVTGGLAAPPAIRGMVGIFATAIKNRLVSLSEKIRPWENHKVRSISNITEGAFGILANFSRIGGANKTVDFDMVMSEIDRLKSQQRSLQSGFSISNNLYSASRQAFNMFLNIMQTIFNSENEAKRTIASNLR
jgi:hypothetical protein